jgi:hypothetical protein
MDNIYEKPEVIDIDDDPDMKNPYKSFYDCVSGGMDSTSCEFGSFH